MAGKQLIKNCAQSVNIGQAGELRDFTSGLLGRHVAGRAEHFHGAGHGAVCFDQPSQAKVGQVRFAFRVD